jgi:hypothetical protein
MNKESSIRYHEARWKQMGPGGLVMVGLGLSVVGHGVERKMADAPWWDWGLWGTLGLVVTNAGLAIFGDGVKHRTRLEELRESLDAGESTEDESA